MTRGLVLLGDLLDRPGERRSKGFLHHRSTGFADGHQPVECPFLRTTLPQLAHEQAVRQHDQVDVPGLALEITQLTAAQSDVLLAVPMERLRARPAMPIDPHDPARLPGDPVRYQDL